MTDLLIVADEDEKIEALGKGWDRKDIILPKFRQLEGRRFENAYVTWGVLWDFVHGNDALLEVLHRTAISGGSAVHVGPIPEVRHKPTPNAVMRQILWNGG